MTLLLCCYQAYAQQRTINGTVTDNADGTPLPGVIVLATNRLTVQTDAMGRYSIHLPEQVTELEFRLLGYLSLKRKVPAGPGALNVSMARDNKQLGEVVVVGYGAVKKTDLTGAVGIVDMKDVVKAPVPSLGDALAGRVAGLSVQSPEGQPGSQPQISIRGIGSITQDVSPLFVIDGFPNEGFNLSSLNMDDIESVTVLKDASSTAIYGARGANGVIVITTRKGKSAAPVIQYNGSLGVSTITKRMPMMDSYEFIKFQLERFPTEAAAVYYPDLDPGETPDPERYRNAKFINWQDKLLRNGLTNIHNVSVSGGNDMTKYLVSGSIYNGLGAILNTQYKRYQLRVNLDQRLTKNLTGGVNLNYSQDKASGIQASGGIIGGSATSALFVSAWGYRPVAGPQPGAEAALENELQDPFLNPGNDFRMNPVMMVENEDIQNKLTDININTYLTYKLADQFTFTVRGMMNRRLGENTYFHNSRSRLGITRPGITALGVQAGATYSEFQFLSNENILSYTRQWGKHNLDAKAGLSFQRIQAKSIGLRVQNIPNEELGLSGLDEGVPLSNSSVIGESKLQSLFSSLNYNFGGQYFLTFTMRADGSSKFSPENRWGYFPSGAFAWRLSEWAPLKELSFLNEAKIRASYGLAGNNRVGDFSYLPSLRIQTGDYYSFNNQQPSRGGGPTDLGNANLKWERSKQTDVGVDLSLFNNRVSLNADWYRKVTDDLLLNANISYVAGYTTAYKNIGSIENTGLEFTLGTTNIDKGQFRWETGFNISFNQNKVLRLNDSEPFMFSTVSWDGNYSSTPLYQTKVGQPVSAFWGVLWDGVYQFEDFDLNSSGAYVLKAHLPTNGNARANIKPGDIKYKDITGDGVVNSSDRTVIGRTLPKHIGGLSNNFSYKGLSMHVFFQWSYGNDIFNANRVLFEGGYAARPLQNQYAAYAARWTPENPSNTYFRAGVGGAGSGAGPNGVLSSMTIEDGSYLRLKTVSLEYRLPAFILKKLLVKNISVSATAQNLVTWTSYSGMDPEVSVRNTILTPGFDFSAYPQAKTLVFGLKATF